MAALTVPRALAAAHALWRRDRDLLLPLAAPFLFLPQLAFALLVPRPAPLAEGAGAQELMAATSGFVTDHWLAYLLVIVAAQIGITGVFALYAPGRPSVGEALRRGATIWPRTLLASAAVLLGATLALPLFPLVLARTLLAVPMIAAGRSGERSVGALEAIGRSVKATGGRTLVLTGLSLLVLAGRLFAPWPLEQLDAWLRDLHAPNPVALAVIDAAAAGVGMVAQIAAILVAVVCYRALTGTSKGI